MYNIMAPNAPPHGVSYEYTFLLQTFRRLLVQSWLYEVNKYEVYNMKYVSE